MMMMLVMLLIMMMLTLLFLMMMMLMMLSMYRAGELGLRLVIPLTNGWNMANGQHLIIEMIKLKTMEDIYDGQSIW